MRNILFVIMIFVMCGCKTTEHIDKEHIVIDTIYINKLVRDSVYMLDSVYIREYMHSDTVFIEKDRVKVKYKDRIVNDSMYINKVDTVTRDIIKTIEREQTLFEKIAFIGACIITIVLSVAIILILKSNI